MSTLRRKLRRDIRRQMGQFIAVVVLIALGSALFVASYDAYRNLDQSYRALFSQLHFADVTISGGDSKQVAERVADVDGVSAVTTRTVTETPISVGDTKLIGRVVGAPVNGPAAVDRVEVVEGRRFASPSAGVLVEQHLAAHFDLHPGDRVRVRGPDGWRNVTVTGVAASTEYLWPARSRQDLFPSPDSFGVLFAPEPLVRDLAGGPNETLVRVDPARRTHVIAKVRDVAVRAGAGTVTTRAEQASNAVLQEDIQGFQSLALLFPMLFLSAAAMATAVLLRRRVTAERTIIGTLRACGCSRRQVLAHYLGYGVAAGTLGSVLGVPVGLLAARELTAAYTGALDLPSTINAIYPVSIAVGLVFGVLTGAVAAWLPARSAARLEPGEAMRGIVPQTGHADVVTRVIPALKRLPATWLLVLRNPQRHVGRTVSTLLGVVLALLLVLVSAGMIDTIRVLVARQFGQIERSDAQVVLAGPADDMELGALTGIDGVAAVERVAALPVTLVAGDERYATTLRGFRADTSMHRFTGLDGTQTTLPGNGVLLGAALEEQLDVAAGDRVELLDDRGSRIGTVDVHGFVDEPLGSPAYASLDTFGRLAPDQPVGIVALRFDAGADPSAVVDRLQARDEVLAVSRTGALRDAVEQFMGLFYAFVGAMLVCGGLLAFGILFTTMSVNLAERTVETATLRASGVSRRRLARLITAENLLVTVLGIAPGLVLGWLAAGQALSAYSSDMFRLELAMSPLTFVLAAGGIMVAALASQVPGLRAMRRTDIASVVRERTA